MKYILDTHTLLWVLFEDEQLSIVPLLSVGARPQQDSPCQVFEFCKEFR